MKEPLTAKELAALYHAGDFSTYTHEKIFNDAKYNFESLKSAPFFGEETLGIYVDIFRKLGDLNYAPALYELGLLYYHGEFWLPENYETSFGYHSRAAELGYADALFELYVYYSTGIHVEVNNEMAMDFCRKAAELGHVRACYNMGAFYATGNGVEKNMDEAVRWYEKASGQGHVKATETLNYMFEHGEGVEEDKEKSAVYMARLKQWGRR
jgi:TPR repeat protein